MQKRRQAMVVRSMDMAIAVCLLTLLLHIFWIRPVSLSVWRWVDAAGLFAFYVFVRLSSHREIKVFVALFPLCFVVEFTGGTFCYHCHHICDACKRGDLKTRAEILQFSS